MIESDPGVFTELIRGFGMRGRGEGGKREVEVATKIDQDLVQQEDKSIVFTPPKLLPLGVQGLQVEELWSLDKESFQKLQYRIYS